MTRGKDPDTVTRMNQLRTKVAQAQATIQAAQQSATEAKDALKALGWDEAQDTADQFAARLEAAAQAAEAEEQRLLEAAEAACAALPGATQ